ncbi:MAG: TfoX/Sxy family protein [Gallionella sp.]
MVSPRNEFADYVVELMSEWATVSARKMFGGHGIYRDGMMFALIVEDELFFKADALNVAQFKSEDSHPFAYQSKTRTVKVSYWSAPPACLESPAEMSEWCQLGFAAAIRARSAKPKPRSKKAKAS